MTATRVLWLIKGMGVGGAERLTALTAGRIDPDRYQVDVAYLLSRKDTFVPELEAQGVEVIALDAHRTLELGWPLRLRRLLSERRYPIVHTHSPASAVIARRLAGPTTRLVHTEHNLWGSYRWPTYAANAATFHRNQRVIAVSHGVASSIAAPWWVRALPTSTVETLHHGVDLCHSKRGGAARAAARTRLDIGPATPVIGTVANLGPKKDHAGLLEAVDGLRWGIPDLVLLLIGTGPLEATLRADVRRRGIDDHIRFLGARDDVYDLLPALDLFVLGSRYEGLPISLLEAMAAGVACVATRVGGVPEAMEDGQQGVLVPAGDPDALAHAIRDLLDDPDRRSVMGDRGIAHVQEHFSIDRAAARITAIYDEMLHLASESSLPTPVSRS